MGNTCFDCVKYYDCASEQFWLEVFDGCNDCSDFSEGVPMIPVDSIVIPARFVAVAGRWYSSGADKLYAVCSTGNLTRGNRRPRGCDSDEKWYYSIWCDLFTDVGYAASSAHAGYNYQAGDDVGDCEGHDSDYPVLVEFEDWVQAQVDALAECYGLEDWDGK